MLSGTGSISVGGIAINAADTRQRYREQIARVTLDSMVQFVGLLDDTGTVLEINKVALDAVGVSLADVEGQKFWDTFWWQVSPEINQGIRDAIAKALTGEFVRWDTPIYGRAGGKETIIIDASIMPVKDDEGRVVFLCCEGRDITEKKAFEREIAEKNQALQGLLERIRELDEIKTQFFANVSHELRTPLALILGPAQRVMDDDGDMTPEERRDAAEVIARNARMLLKHVNDLLDLSRLEAGKLHIELVDTDLCASLRFLASHFAVLAADRGIDYDVDAAGACVSAVDPDKLQRVVMNLIANAFKFVPNNGKVRVSLESNVEEITIVVEDSGPGVKPEMRKAIFERFRQVDGGKNRKAGGTGLGLAIAKEFVELHKGRIAVKDSKLGGARFEVTLPALHVSGGREVIAPDIVTNRATLEGMLEELTPARGNVAVERRAEPRGDPHTSVVSGRPRVLVVEDNADMNRFICEALEDEYEVFSAFDGREGLEKTLQFRPALIVSDIMMPNVSGDEMIAQMRNIAEIQSTPVLVLSAKADEALMTKLLEEGAQDFIVKPFSAKDLKARVHNLVLAQQARESLARQHREADLLKETQLELQEALVQAEAARTDAERANRAKSQFLASMSHELRTPLNAIQGHIQLIEMGVHGPVTEPQKDALARVQRSQHALSLLITDVLNFARIEAGRVEYDIMAVSVKETVTAVLQMVEPQLQAKRLQATVAVSDELRVKADPDKFRQILLNLLSNAIKFTMHGGTIAIEMAERIGAPPGMAMVRVRDTGIGIARSKQDVIFDPFVQVHRQVSAAAGGIGLGLAISRDLARGMGGDLRVRSEEGSGSSFTVSLPRA